jgi:RNA polymerase sigma-70 factor, ECF subfamily
VRAIDETRERRRGGVSGLASVSELPLARKDDLAGGRARGLLVARASRGDVEAFSRLVEEHSGLVHRVACRMLGRDDVQDASQEVWVRVWRNIKRFRGESSFGTWLHTVATNTCLNIRQRESRRGEWEGEDEASYLPEPPGGEADPEAAALHTERREEINVALGHVRTEHRKALVLRHMEGLTYAEIAEALEVPEGTAKGWVSRGRVAMLGVLTADRSLGGIAEGAAP